MGPTPAVAAVRGAVRRSLEPLDDGSLVLVACSGGADSLALAAATAFVAPRMGLQSGAVTVDHGLATGSAEVAARVAASLSALGLSPVRVVAVAVGRAGGPEAAARTARYAALEEVAASTGAAAILLAHSRDDQAESVLLGLARGSGGRSLSGMAPVNGRYRRPLLGLDRTVLRAACRDQGLDPWDDPANTDPALTRVRVRTTVLPTLEAELGPGIALALARTADLLRADADALDGWAAALRDQARLPTGELHVDTLAAAPAAVRSRALRSAAIDAGCPPTDLSAAHIAALDGLITHWRGQGPLHLPGRVVATRSGERISVMRRL